MTIIRTLGVSCAGNRLIRQKKPQVRIALSTQHSLQDSENRDFSARPMARSAGLFPDLGPNEVTGQQRERGRGLGLAIGQVEGRAELE